MKYVKQFLIILGISLLGEVLKFGLSLPIPASIYGRAVLFICLMTGIVKLDDVREAGKFLIEIMPMMFIPAGVGLMDSWKTLQPVFLPVCIITVITIFTVMLATGRLSQWIIRRGNVQEPETETASVGSVCES